VVLISLDTFRADHLGCQGNPTVATPRIDALAAQGTRFADATSPAPTTLAAHTSMMTGLVPRRHGVVRNGFVVHPGNTTLAELLEARGFRCGAVLGSFALASDFDFDQGFEHFDEDFDLLVDAAHFDQNQRRAERVTDAALAFVDGVGAGERLFLFAHYFDAHAPYDPPAPWNALYAEPGAPEAASQEDVERAVQVHQRAVLGTDDVPGARGLFRFGLSRELLEGAAGEPRGADRALAALYAGEVSYLDHHVGRLLDGLAERGVLDDAIVVLTGDHGETFWEHGDVWNHGLWLYDTTIRVPLIVRLPGAAGGAVVDAPVSTVDVVPTLAELLGLDLPEPVDGRSLAPALAGGAAPLRPIVSEATQPVALPRPEGSWPLDPLPKSVRDGPWKYVVAPYLGVEQLFHLARDPGEHTNLLAAPDARAAAKRDELRAVLEGWLRERTPRPSSFNRAQAAAVAERLAELGYFESSEDE
jgi:arylsulfatase A-like enzyme